METCEAVPFTRSRRRRRCPRPTTTTLAGLLRLATLFPSFPFFDGAARLLRHGVPHLDGGCAAPPPTIRFLPKAESSSAPAAYPCGKQGISTTNRAPPKGAGALDTEMSPPWSIAILRTIA